MHEYLAVGKILIIQIVVDVAMGMDDQVDCLRSQIVEVGCPGVGINKAFYVIIDPQAIAVRILKACEI
jgi:hypothetical protein